MKGFSWKQIGGDMDPGTYGGTIAKSDGSSIELIQIQPVREYVSDAEALQVGFPFWTKEAYFDLDDLPDHRDLKAALRYVGLDLDDVPPAYREVAMADALMQYGVADEGKSGWAKDIIPPPMRVKWFGSKGAAGWRYLADEDREFEELIRDAEHD